MKAIVTKYHGPGNVRGARFSASDEDGNKVWVSYDYSANADANHEAAARKLCEKMGWGGRLIGGGLGSRMVWVFDPEVRSNGEPVDIVRVRYWGS
jgi:hypothetical protein